MEYLYSQGEATMENVEVSLKSETINHDMNSFDSPFLPILILAS